MTTSELITPQHLQKKAVIYVRQSTLTQVILNQESLRLQYALEQRAQSLGWRSEDIEVIDADLGLTGASAHDRIGFQELVTKVTLGQVGIILSSDVTRLSRNCSDWYPLLDVCGYRGCLIADQDGVYDPGSTNGRLLLGLKGQLSELELHTIRARMTAGLLNKASRGELALPLPIGLIRDVAGRVQKDPHREVQDRLHLIFTTFLQKRSASKVLEFLNSHDLFLPRRDRFGDLVWKRPTVAAILQILKNPAYAGAFVYGRTRTVHTDPASPRAKQVRLPQEEWKIRVPDVYPAYISWPTFEQIEAACLPTTTRPTTATRRVGYRAQVPRCCRGWSPVANVGTRWLSNTNTALATSAIICASNIGCPFANTSRRMRWMRRWWRRSSRRFLRWSWMCMSRLRRRSTQRKSRWHMRSFSIWNACATKSAWLSASSCGSIRRTVWSPPNSKSAGKPHSRN